MKVRMLSLLSIVVVLILKSLDISAKDYHNFRVYVNAIPAEPYSPDFLPRYPITEEVDSIVYQLANANGIMEKYVGTSTEISETYAAFEKLRLLASEEELNQLMEHPSPVVKIYAHRALVDNEMNMNCDVELQLLQDSTCVDWYASTQLTNSTVQELVQLSYLD